MAPPKLSKCNGCNGHFASAEIIKNRKKGFKNRKKIVKKFSWYLTIV